MRTHAQLLKKAKELYKAAVLVHSPIRRGICQYIVEASDGSQSDWDVQYSIRLKIGEDLTWRQAYLEDWLVAEGHATEKELINNPAKLITTRLAWFDNLIEFYKDKK